MDRPPKQRQPTSARTPALEPRKPGRPSRAAEPNASSGSLLPSREQILARATELAKAEPLAEVSIAGLAREFGVTPALIHYYIGSRDDLISGVVNRYFKAWTERVPPLAGKWRTDLERLARLTYELMAEYGGVLRYIVSHNRFRLFQKVGDDEIDYGVEFLDTFARVLRDGGFTAQQSALAYHLLAQFVLASAHALVSHQLPGEHEQYVFDRLQATSKQRYGGAHFMAKRFSRLDADTAFIAGLQILLDGFEAWLARNGRGRPKNL